MSDVLIKTLGNWDKSIADQLRQSLNASVNVVGRTGEEACRHALILMVQSAAHMTPKAPKHRPVKDNPKFRHLLTKAQYAKMSPDDRQYYFRYTALRYSQSSSGGSRITELYANRKQSISNIPHGGLAKRSWSWGMKSLGMANEGRAIPGTYEVYPVISEKLCGYAKENKLKYIKAIMPMGFEDVVQQRVANKIMAQAAVKMQNDWAKERGDIRPRALASFFKGAA